MLGSLLFPTADAFLNLWDLFLLSSLTAQSHIDIQVSQEFWKSERPKANSLHYFRPPEAIPKTQALGLSLRAQLRRVRAYSWGPWTTQSAKSRIWGKWECRFVLLSTSFGTVSAFLPCVTHIPMSCKNSGKPLGEEGRLARMDDIWKLLQEVHAI